MTAFIYDFRTKTQYSMRKVFKIAQYSILTLTTTFILLLYKKIPQHSFIYPGDKSNKSVQNS